MNTSNLVHKTVRSFKNDGLVETFIKAVRYPFVPHIQRNKEAKIFRHQDIEDRFTQIYELNYWGSRESISGVGSNLSNTENLRTVLPELLIKYEIRSIFDAPCGDFNWMKHVRRQYPMDYTGADIVAPLIQSLNSKYQDQNTRFLHLDLTKHKFPKADLMICRDCLFHLSYEDTKSVSYEFYWRAHSVSFNEYSHSLRRIHKQRHYDRRFSSDRHVLRTL